MSEVLYTIGAACRRLLQILDLQTNRGRLQCHACRGPSATARRCPVADLAARTGIGVWLRDLIISLAISAFIIIFLYQPVKVEGTSMMPSLEDQERIFVNKFVYRLEPIERGDIVVFRYPRDPSKSYIKRVIGMAGDRSASMPGRST